MDTLPIGRLGAMAILVVGGFSLACWQAPMVERFARVDAMVGHEEGMEVARTALQAGDLDAARAAGKEMAAGAPVPGVDDQMLAELRFAAAKVADAQDLASTSMALADLTHACANCHRGWEVPPPGPLTDELDDAIWLALAFEDDAGWLAAATGELQRARTWEDRRRLAAERLVAESGGK